MDLELPARAEGYAVTVKAVIPCDDRILLLRKENGRWDLPGGKLEPGESVVDCLLREVVEETGITVEVERMVEPWVSERPGKLAKFVVTCLCRSLPADPAVRLSAEHVQAGCFRSEEMDGLFMLEGTRNAVRMALLSR